jgi:hypothetical protein
VDQQNGRPVRGTLLAVGKSSGALDTHRARILFAVKFRRTSVDDAYMSATGRREARILIWFAIGTVLLLGLMVALTGW